MRAVSQVLGDRGERPEGLRLTARRRRDVIETPSARGKPNGIVSYHAARVAATRLIVHRAATKHSVALALLFLLLALLLDGPLDDLGDVFVSLLRRDALRRLPLASLAVGSAPFSSRNSTTSSWPPRRRCSGNDPFRSTASRLAPASTSTSTTSSRPCGTPGAAVWRPIGPGRLIRLGLAQSSRHLRVPARRREVQGAVTVRVHHLHVRPVLNQHLHHVRVALEHGGDERVGPSPSSLR